ncbi:isochorismate synthase [Portibacter marinus]|uniref:isochorismate synthase n=1 Tax=Portibacter marinus TaxID=2898660 RepID=UPI001F02E91C|nr:isochorismate synthase [Portibacter marinus]
MSKKDATQWIEELIKNRIPFVLFREPGAEARIIIQNKPLDHYEGTSINKPGFYIFPFSTKETSKPIHFSDDTNILYSELANLNIDLHKLPKSKIPKQDIYEVSKEQYVEDLKTYLKAFNQKDLKKAIYSRVQEEELDRPLYIDEFFKKLSNQYPKAFTYAMHIPGDGIWIGASPELLLSYANQKAKTVALAGTLKIDHKYAAPQWTRKEIDEHRLVEKYIIALCESQDLEFVKSQVRTSSTGKVYHLKSDFTLQIPLEKIQQFLEKLHPTPAISGLPQKESLDLIYEVEKYERSYYCGFLGYVEGPDKFNLYINLRCMKITGDNYYLFAGGGITPESDIEKEWEETKVKMSTLTDLLEKDANYEEISPISC